MDVYWSKSWQLTFLGIWEIIYEGEKTLADTPPTTTTGSRKSECRDRYQEINGTWILRITKEIIRIASNY